MRSSDPLISGGQASLEFRRQRPADDAHDLPRQRRRYIVHYMVQYMVHYVVHYMVHCMTILGNADGLSLRCQNVRAPEGE